MPRSKLLEHTFFDPEIERTLRRICKEKKKKKDYAMPSVNGATSIIRRLAIQANNFEIKPAIIQIIQQIIQFGGLSQEDPNVHIVIFVEICDTFKHNGVIDDVIRLRFFPFSLREKAKAWLMQLRDEH